MRLRDKRARDVPENEAIVILPGLIARYPRVIPGSRSKIVFPCVRDSRVLAQEKALNGNDVDGGNVIVSAYIRGGQSAPG